jgi:hypothetical protein
VRLLRFLLNAATALSLVIFAVELSYWLTRSASHVGVLNVSWQSGFYLGFPLEIDVPHWTSAVLFVILLAVQVAVRWHRRIPHGHCPACGYDLRATPERCPECGTDVPAAAR